MKKGFLVSVILSVLLLTSCSPGKKILTGANYYPEQDQNVSMMNIHGNMVAETETGFYYTEYFDRRLRYIEKQSMENIVLCGKPNCHHTDHATCNAFIEQSVDKNLYYYQGENYYVESVEKEDEVGSIRVLSKTSLDGTRRQRLWEITWDTDLIPDGAIQCFTFHRGKFYYVVMGTEPLRLLLTYDVQTKKVEEIYRTEEYIYELKGIGDHMYWYQLNHKEDFPTITRYHTLTKEMDEPWEKGICVTANTKNIFALQVNETQTSKKVVIADRNGENSRDTGVETMGTIAVDETYIYTYYNESRGRNPLVEIYRIDTGEKVQSTEFPVDEKCSLMPSSGDQVLLYAEPGTVSHYFLKSAIGTPDFQWYEVEKVN